ncbi:hypothetical protein KIPB_000669 [Kipferlia bialata]|uniref:Uncharacterized protein n=1 Tax=Kipferlia bialata TaxID=797122 RepID=A0A9K3CQW7_9EUKA|nr:hypothetical protein KIPB_000669 [Kipferlia bialata]|eukprot:g669.t1
MAAARASQISNLKYHYQACLQNDRVRRALDQFCCDRRFDTTTLECLLPKRALSMAIMHMFITDELMLTGVPEEVAAAYVITADTGFHSLAPGHNRSHALTSLHLVHHLVHSVRASPGGTKYIPALLHVTGCLHRGCSDRMHSVGVSHVAAKQSGILNYLPLGFKELMTDIMVATSEQQVLSIAIDIKAFSLWMLRLSPEERGQTVQCRRPEVGALPLVGYQQ